MICGLGIAGYSLTESADKRWITPMSSIGVLEFNAPVAGVIYDKIWGQIGYQPTVEEIMNVNYTYNPTWTNNTYMLADFNSSDFFNAGSFNSTYPGSLVSFDIHKVYTKNGSTVDEVVESGLTPTTYTYYNYKNSHDAQYYVVANGQNTSTDKTYWAIKSSSGSVTETPQGFYLIDTTNNNSYFFNFNVEGGSYQQNNTTNQYQLNQNQDAFYHGIANYSSGQFSGILYNGNTYTDAGNTQTVLDSFMEFYNSKRPCILKDRQGNVKNVLLTDYGESYLNIYLNEQVKVSIISWKEVAQSNG
jgi:hypothetical protein